MGGDLTNIKKHIKRLHRNMIFQHKEKSQHWRYEKCRIKELEQRQAKRGEERAGRLNYGYMKKPERNPRVSTCTEHILFKGDMNKMPCTSIHGASRRYRHQMKISLPGSGHLSPSYFQGPDALRTRQATAITFVTQHSHERTLPLKPPFTLEAGHKEMSPPD